jgi:hypothetical protein
MCASYVMRKGMKSDSKIVPDGGLSEAIGNLQLLLSSILWKKPVSFLEFRETAFHGERRRPRGSRKCSSCVGSAFRYELCYVPVLDDFVTFETEKMNLSQPACAWVETGQCRVHCNKVAFSEHLPYREFKVSF